MSKKVFTLIMILTLSFVALANTGVAGDEMVRIAKQNSDIRRAIGAAQEPGWVIDANVNAIGDCTIDGKLMEGQMYRVDFIKVVHSPNPHYAYRSMAILVATATLDCEGNILTTEIHFK